MKRKIFFSMFMFLVISYPLSAQNKFEGKVNIKVTSGGESTSMEYYLKDNKMRFGTGEDVFTIFDYTSNKIYVIMPAEEMYMEVPLQGMSSPAEDYNDAIGTNIQPTGETKEINGHLCEKWIYKGDDGVTESWLAMDLGEFVFMDNPMGGDKTAWQSEIEASGYFPMLVINRNKAGEEQSRYEVTSIEQESLSNDLFTPPGSYKKMDMPGMD